MNDVEILLERISSQKKEILSYLEKRLSEVKEEYQPPSSFVQLSIEQLKSYVEQSLSKYDRIVSSVESRVGSLTRFNEEVLTTVKVFSSKLDYLSNVVTSFNVITDTLSNSIETLKSQTESINQYTKDENSKTSAVIADLLRTISGVKVSLKSLNKSLSSTNSLIDKLRVEFKQHKSDNSLFLRLKDLEDVINSINIKLQELESGAISTNDSLSKRIDNNSNELINSIKTSMDELEKKIPSIPVHDLTDEISLLKF